MHPMMPPIMAAGCGPLLLTGMFDPIPAGRLCVVEVHGDDEVEEVEEVNEIEEANEFEEDNEVEAVSGVEGVDEAREVDEAAEVGEANAFDDADGVNEPGMRGRATEGVVQGRAYRASAERNYRYKQGPMFLTES